MGKKNAIMDSVIPVKLTQPSVPRPLEKVTVDLFVFSLNMNLTFYCSPFDIPLSLVTDAILLPWGHLQVYVFLLLIMVRSLVIKLRMPTGVEMTLITPFWRQKEWSLDLLEMLVESPLALPELRDRLCRPLFCWFPCNLPKLQLTVWRDSSDLPGTRVSVG